MTETTEKRKTSQKRLAVALVLLAALALAGLAYYLTAPAALSDADALDMLPQGAVILTRRTYHAGREEDIEYRYTERHKYCLVERTERLTLRYAKGEWAPIESPAALGATEDWSALAGYWTERTEGPEAWAVSVYVSGFASGTLTGQVSYQDAAGAWEGQASEAFAPAETVGGDGLMLLSGLGFFRHCSLLADRDSGLYFNNAETPMERADRPAALPAGTDEALLERVRADGEKTWLAAAVPLDVYAAPEMDGEILGTADVGAVLAYTGQLSEDGPVQVLYEGAVGYVSGGGALALTEELGVATAIAEVHVRSGPDQETDALGVLAAGDRLVCTGQVDGWVRVLYQGRREAYVAGEYLTTEPLTAPE